MDNYEKNKLLVHIARLYYENDYSQQQIAKQLKLSRPYVSKLLHAAKESGIVKIQVIDPLNTESVLEKELRERFGLDKVLIAPSKADGNDLQYLGETSARFLDSIIKDGDIIGTSWGNTMFQVSKALVRRAEVNNLTYVQLCGGISNINSAVHAEEIANNFSQRLGCASYLMQLPAVVGSKELKKMLEDDVNMEKLMDLGRRSRIAMFTIGAFGADGRRSALVQAGYLDKQQTQSLVKKGAVGDICSHVIDEDGRLCDEELDERTIAVSMEDIRKKEYRIGVAQGLSKEESILAALKNGIMNVLITNEKTADAVLKHI